MSSLADYRRPSWNGRNTGGHVVDMAFLLERSEYDTNGGCWLGTAKDNMRDMVAKGRNRVPRGYTRLSDADRAFIMEHGGKMPYRTIGRILGRDFGTVKRYHLGITRPRQADGSQVNIFPPSNQPGAK